MKNKILVMVLVMLMVFSSAAAAFADSGIRPYNTGGVSFTIDRTSGTTADVDIVVYFTQTVNEYSVVVFLQKLVNGQWENDNTNDEYVFYNNGFSSNVCVFSHDYDSLSYGTTYRLMVVSRDKVGSVECRNTYYSNPF